MPAEREARRELLHQLLFAAQMAHKMEQDSPRQMRIDLFITTHGVRIRVGVSEAAAYHPMRAVVERIVSGQEILDFNGNAVYEQMKVAVREALQPDNQST